MATYLVLLLGYSMPNFLLIPVSKILTFAGLVFVMTSILPMANLLMFKAFGTLPSLQMKTRRERIVPFILITIIYMVITGMFFYKVAGNVNFNRVMLIITTLVLAGTMVTFFEKISIHSLAMGGMMGILLPLNKALETGALLKPTAAILVMGGLVMSARLYLNLHSLREVLLGVVIGFSTAFLGMILLF